MTYMKISLFVSFITQLLHKFIFCHLVQLQFNQMLLNVGLKCFQTFFVSKECFRSAKLLGDLSSIKKLQQNILLFYDIFRWHLGFLKSNSFVSLFLVKNSIGQDRRNGDDQQSLSETVRENEGKSNCIAISTIERKLKNALFLEMPELILYTGFPWHKF